jgi:hypothetical protein
MDFQAFNRGFELGVLGDIDRIGACGQVLAGNRGLNDGAVRQYDRIVGSPFRLTRRRECDQPIMDRHRPLLCVSNGQVADTVILSRPDGRDFDGLGLPNQRSGRGCVCLESIDRLLAIRAGMTILEEQNRLRATSRTCPQQNQQKTHQNRNPVESHFYRMPQENMHTVAGKRNAVNVAERLGETNHEYLAGRSYFSLFRRDLVN